MIPSTGKFHLNANLHAERFTTCLISTKYYQTLEDRVQLRGNLPSRMSLGGELLLATFGSAFEPLQSSLFKESLSEEELYNKNSQNMIATDHELKVNNSETWKNFPFPPTPPTSPISSPYPVETNEERFQPVCGEFVEETFLAEEEYIPEDENKLKSMLIKDCMWNGASPDSSEKRRRFSKLERIRLLCQTPPLVECNARILSVDPTEVFPYPLNGCTQTDDREEKDITEREDESEEEVEVDVVTIENGSVKQEERTNCEGEATTEEPEDVPEPVEELPADLDNKDDDDEEEMLERKVDEDDDDFSDSLRSFRRVRKFSSPPESPSKPKKAKYSSSGESNDESEENDSEYARATHNVLERKRRNDLKLRFQRLRDSVPELKGNDRAPKVAILRKSWEFIKHLKEEERKLVSETERQKRINGLLLKRLLMLNQGKQ